VTSSQPHYKILHRDHQHRRGGYKYRNFRETRSSILNYGQHAGEGLSRMPAPTGNARNPAHLMV